MKQRSSPSPSPSPSPSGLFSPLARINPNSNSSTLISLCSSFANSASPSSAYANPNPNSNPAPPSCYPQSALFTHFHIPVTPIIGAPYYHHPDFSSKQETNLAQGLKLGNETYDHLWTGISEKDNETVLRHSKSVSFPTTSEFCSSFVVNCPETNPQFTCSSESKSSAVDVAGQSDTRTCNLPLESLLLTNLEPDGDDAFGKNYPFIYSPVTTKEPNYSFNSKDKEASLSVLIDKSKDGEIEKPNINKFMDALAIPESYMQVNIHGPRDLALELPSAEEVKPVEKHLGDNDSDLDSPCWRGTLAAKQETLKNSGPVDSHCETSTFLKGTLAANQKACADSVTANGHFETAPEPSHFFLRNDKQSISYYGNECRGDDFSFFLDTSSSAVNLLSEDQRSTNSVLPKSSSDRRCIIESHCSHDICSLDKEDDLKNSRSTSFPSLSRMFPLHAKNYCKSKLQVTTGPNIAVSGRENKDDMLHSSTSISSASKTFCCSSSCRVGVPSYIETYLDANRSFSRHPRLDIQKIVITMNKLSKLLMKNCSNDLDSLNEHERDIMKRIIGNINMCIGNRVGETPLLPDSSHA